MKIKEEWKQRVRKREALLVILITVLLLGGMGVYSLRTGSLPPTRLSPRLEVVALLFLWFFAPYSLFGRAGKHSPQGEYCFWSALPCPPPVG